MVKQECAEAEGCKKYDCPDYPYIAKGGELSINSICRLCKHFKKFDLYKSQKKQGVDKIERNKT